MWLVQKVEERVDAGREWTKFKEIMLICTKRVCTFFKSIGVGFRRGTDG